MVVLIKISLRLDLIGPVQCIDRPRAFQDIFWRSRKALHPIDDLFVCRAILLQTVTYEYEYDLEQW